MYYLRIRQFKTTFLLYAPQNIDSEQRFALFPLIGRAKRLLKEVSNRGLQLKFLVVLHQNGLFFGREIKALTLTELLRYLRIELQIVDGSIITYPAGDIDTNEAAASRRIGEQITVIAGRYERSITLQFAYSRFVARYVRSGPALGCSPSRPNEASHTRSR